MKKLIALLTAAVATLTSAWAALPVAVWEDLNVTGEALTINGVTLNPNLSETGNVLSDTAVKIVDKPVLLTLGNKSSITQTVIVKYSGVSSNPAAESQIVTFTTNANTGNDYIGICVDTEGAVFGSLSGVHWDHNTNVSSGNIPLEGESHILAARFKMSYATDPNLRGTFASIDGTVKYNVAGLVGQNQTIRGIALGGGYLSGTTGKLPVMAGMIVEKVAVFNAALTEAEISSYRWPSDTVVYTGTVENGQVTWDKPLPETPAANDYLKFVGAGDIAVPANYASFGQITIGDGVNLTGVAPADVSSGKFEGAGAIVIESDCTLTVPAGVTVKMRGNIAVNLTNDGTFDVESGTCSVNTPDKQKIKGTVIIRKNAKFVNKRESDALAYGSSAIVHVYGTLDFESTRWTLGGNNKIYLYTDAVVEGAGQGNDGALDFNSSASDIYVKPNGSTAGKVTCSATFRTANKATITIDQGMELEVTSVFKSNNDNVTKAGAGLMTVKSAFAMGATVNAGTLKLVGISPTRAITMGNGTLELSQNDAKDAFTFTGTVASAALGNGTIKTAGSTVTLSGTFTNYSGDIDSSAADSKFIIPVDQEVTVGLITSGSKIEIEGMLVHTNKATNAYTNYQGKNLSGLTGNGTFKITGPHYFFTCGTSNLNNYWASTLALWNDRGDSTIADQKGIIFGQPNNANATITIGSLSGAGLIRTDANNGERTIKIVQAKNTEWSGAFNAGDRVKAVVVTGADGATEKTLTLSGTQTHNNDLTIESAGSVKLTGTWIAETVTVAGRLEVLDTATLTATTLTSAGSMKTADSTIYFGSDDLASAEAATKIGTTYYVTLDAAITALTEEQSITDIAILDSSITTLPEGYEEYKIENGAIVARTYVVKVGDKKYETFAAAKSACTGTETIVIISDVDLAKFAKASENTNVAAIEIAEGVTVKGFFPDGGETLPLIINGTFWVRDGYTTDAAHPNNTAVVPVLSGNGVIKENITTSATPTVKIEDYTGWKGSFTETNNGKLTLKFSVAKSASAYYYSAEEAIAAVEGGTEVTNISLTDEDIGESYTIDEDGKIVLAKTATDLFLEAINGDATEVTLTGDVAIESMITLEKTFAINLDGHTLSFAGDTAKTKSLIQVVNEATLTINGTTDGSKVIGRLNAGKAKNNNGSITLNGGTYEVGEGQTVLHVNGECKASNVTIKNATIISANDNGIQLNGAGTHTITGSTITGATAVYVKAGTVSISSSTLTATGAKAEVQIYNNGSVATGDALVLDNCVPPYPAIVSVTIDAATTITSANGAAVLSYAREGNTRQQKILPAALKSKITEAVATEADLFDDYVEPSTDLPGAEEVPAEQKDAYNAWAAENGIEATGEYTDAQKANFATAYAMNVTLTAEQKEAGITIEEAAQKVIENEVPSIDMAELVAGNLEDAVKAINEKYSGKVEASLVEVTEGTLKSTETAKFYKLSITIKTSTAE